MGRSADNPQLWAGWGSAGEPVALLALAPLVTAKWLEKQSKAESHTPVVGSDINRISRLSLTMGPEAVSFRMRGMVSALAHCFREKLGWFMDGPASSSGIR